MKHCNTLLFIIIILLFLLLLLLLMACIIMVALSQNYIYVLRTTLQCQVTQSQTALYDSKYAGEDVKLN